MVVDALSMKSQANLLLGCQLPLELCAEMEKLNLGFLTQAEGVTTEIR